MLYICSTTNSREETHHENSSELQEVRDRLFEPVPLRCGYCYQLCENTAIYKPALCVNMNKHAEKIASVNDDITRKKKNIIYIYIYLCVCVYMYNLYK